MARMDKTNSCFNISGIKKLTGVIWFDWFTTFLLRMQNHVLELFIENLIVGSLTN
jgi:hypothetical protein